MFPLLELTFRNSEIEQNRLEWGKARSLQGKLKINESRASLAAGSNNLYVDVGIVEIAEETIPMTTELTQLIQNTEIQPHTPRRQKIISNL